MRREMTMTEVLAKLTLAKKKMNSAGYGIMTQSGGQIYISAKKKNRDVSITNTPVEEVVKGIQSNYDTTLDNFSNCWKLLMIKEAVNSSIRIQIPNPDFRKSGTIEATITEVLSLCGDGSLSKKYYASILNRMKRDWETIQDTIDRNEKNVLSEDKITAYVVQRLQALKENTSKAATEASYSKYAPEYIEANTIEPIDPLNLKEQIDKLENWMEEFYSTVNYKLSEVNSKTKVWVDFDLDNDFWGFVIDEDDE